MNCGIFSLQVYLEQMDIDETRKQLVIGQARELAGRAGISVWDLVYALRSQGIDASAYRIQNPLECPSGILYLPLLRHFVYLSRRGKQLVIYDVRYGQMKFPGYGEMLCRGAVLIPLISC